MSHFITVDPHNVAHLREKIDVLLVTATPVELDAVGQRLQPLPEGGPWKTYVYKETYGSFANHTVAIVKCDMGSSGRGAALTVRLSAIEVWCPRAVIMVGIAFGKDPKEQGMCDVLVANSVIPYEVARIGQKQYVPRAPHPPTDALLLNRFANVTDWNYQFRGATVKTRIGPLLSGEKLIDNARAKARLFSLFPHAIGGEMEGAGISAAADRCNAPWIVVKAICDWGDGKKHKKFQRYAAAAAVSLVEHVLAERACLDALPPLTLLRRCDPFSLPVSALQTGETVGTSLTLAHHSPVAQLSAAVENTRATTGACSTVATGPTTILDVPPAKHTASRTAPGKAHVPVLFTQSETHALRLMAGAPFELPAIAFKFLFPRVDWQQTIRGLRRKGALGTTDAQTLVIARPVLRNVFESSQARKRYESIWLRRLESLREYSDTALLLGFTYMKSERYDDAVDTFTAIAESLEPGSDSLFYKGILERMIVPRFLKRLSLDRRVHLLNAFALCLWRSGEHATSLQYYDQLLRLSRRSANAWGVGQAFINSGVSHYHLGNTKKARRCYEKAIAHAKQTRDKWLQARALNNLGAIRSGESPEEGTALIEKSLAIKLKQGDVAGVAGAFLTRGNILTKAGEHSDALTWYQNAVDLSRKAKLHYILGLALNNIGATYVDLREAQRAIPFYREALQISEREDLNDLRRYAVQGIAVAYNQLEKFKLATTFFDKLSELHKSDPSRLDYVMALHDAGVTAMRAGDTVGAKRRLARALRWARSSGEQTGIFQCH